jgi:hypothetical protein
MDRLRREWKETQIPDEVRLRARNLAWARIRLSAVDRNGLRWVAATSIIVALVGLLWIWGGRQTSIEQVSTPIPKNISLPAIAAIQIIKPLIDMPPVPLAKPVRRPAAPKRTIKPPEKEHERVVLNFKLPESGARMIWVMDSSFQFNGDEQ